MQTTNKPSNKITINIPLWAAQIDKVYAEKERQKKTEKQETKSTHQH